MIFLTSLIVTVVRCQIEIEPSGSFYNIGVGWPSVETTNGAQCNDSLWSISSALPSTGTLLTLFTDKFSGDPDLLTNSEFSLALSMHMRS
jgi:hypothetical protein